MADPIPSVPPILWRRSFLFFCGIAAPGLIGSALGDGRAAMSACLAGILFCWAESPGTLLQRMRVLAIFVTLTMAGATLGFITAHSGLPWVWPAIAFVGAWAGYGATRSGLWPLASRDTAIGFAIGTTLAEPTRLELGYVLLGLGLIVVSRIVDHWLNGPLPPLGGGRSLQKPRSRQRRLRFAFTYAAAATIALALGRLITPDYAPWVVITTLIVMQPDAAASFDRVARRIEGALLGVGGAWLALTLLRPPLAILGVIAGLSLAMPHQLHRRYWLHTALIAGTVLLAHAFSMQDRVAVDIMILDRLVDMITGAVIAAVGTLIAFPRMPEGQRPQ